MVATVAGTWLATLVTSLPAVWGVYASVAATAFYALAKGIEKNSTDLSHGYTTSEFASAIVAVAITVFSSVSNTIPDKFAVIGVVLNLIAFTISRAVAKPDPATLQAGRAQGLVSTRAEFLGDALDEAPPVIGPGSDGVDTPNVGGKK